MDGVKDASKRASREETRWGADPHDVGRARSRNGKGTGRQKRDAGASQMLAVGAMEIRKSAVQGRTVSLGEAHTSNRKPRRLTGRHRAGGMQKWNGIVPVRSRGRARNDANVGGLWVKGRKSAAARGM